MGMMLFVLRCTYRMEDRVEWIQPGLYTISLLSPAPVVMIEFTNQGNNQVASNWPIVEVCTGEGCRFISYNTR